MLWVGLRSVIMPFSYDYTQLFLKDSMSLVAELNFTLQHRDLCHQERVLITDIKDTNLVHNFVVHLI